MKAREMYNWMKANGCMYSDATIRQKIRDMGVVKRWEILRVDDQRFHNTEELLFDRVHRKFMDYNFNEIVFNPREEGERRWMIAEQTNIFQQPQVTPTVQVQNVEESYFTQNEMGRINNAAETYGFSERVLSYSASSHEGTALNIYNTVGILRDGADDNSPTIGFELETFMDEGISVSNLNNFIDALDIRLGHFETDSSISGVEFDSHIFTWNKLKKCKPLFKKMFQELSERGLKSHDGAGLHIHIGRNSFVSERAFEKFYYLVNVTDLRPFWRKIARRQPNGYCQFSELRPGNVTHLRRSINAHRDDHARAVNQQHAATYEIRIFRSTFSSDVIWGDIELLLNLVEFCNADKSLFEKRDVIKGEYVLKMCQTISGINSAFVSSVDTSFLSVMTQQQIMDAMQQALNNNDLAAAQNYLQRLQALQRASNTDEDDA